MSTPILFAEEPTVFYAKLSQLIEEVVERKMANLQPQRVNGLIENPLLDIKGVCTLFSISKPTIYAWIKDKQLKPFKIRGKIVFLKKDIDNLFNDKCLKSI